MPRHAQAATLAHRLQQDVAAARLTAVTGEAEAVVTA